MEKKIADDHHHHDQASSLVVSGDSSARPSLKIRIRITPEMRKQLGKWDKQQEEEAVKQEINVKSEVVKEEEEAAKQEINVKSEVVLKEEEEAVKQEINVKSEAKEEEEEEAVVLVPEVAKESIVLLHHHQVKQELLVLDCSSFELKLEATKRKFHDSYQQIANAKRQRRIQVIDPWNLPQPAAAGGKGKSSKLADGGGGTAKSRILNVILSNKKKNNNNRYNLFSASRSTLLKPSYIC